MSKSFWNLLTNSSFNRFVVPVIQRDYAQGRTDERATTIREKFLDSLGDALTNNASNPLSLDFIYGAENGKQIDLIDGQQRFTTLFLLHWYLAGRSGANDGVFESLKRFTYEARTSSRHFCEMLCQCHSDVFQSYYLLKKEPVTSVVRRLKWISGDMANDTDIKALLDENDETIKESDSEELKEDIIKKFLKDEEVQKDDLEHKSRAFQCFHKKVTENKQDFLKVWKDSKEHPFTFLIQDKNWYLRDWENDPTVLSLLNMLDSISKSKMINQDVKTAWEKLTSDQSPIVFEFLSVNDFGNSEDLYVKMNSRGKPLTPFENFKALFGKHLEELGDDSLKTSYWANIDGDWSATFWEFIKARYKSKNIQESEYYFSIDDTILRYIWLQVEMYSAAINDNQTQPDYYENGRPKLVFEHIDNPKDHSKDWTNHLFENKSPEFLLIKSLERAKEILDLVDELLVRPDSLVLWDSENTSIIDKVFPLIKRNTINGKPEYGNNKEADIMNRILVFVIIYWCCAYAIPATTEQKEKLKGYMRTVRNFLQRYRSKKSAKRIWDSELDKKNYGRAISIILNKMLNQNQDCLDYMCSITEHVSDYFDKESEKNRKLKAYNDDEKKNCYKLEDNGVLKGSILPLLRSDKAIISSDKFEYHFREDNLVLTAKALLASGTDTEYFAIPSGESYNNLSRVAFCDLDLRAWSLALQYDKHNFSERNSKVLESLIKQEESGLTLQNIVSNYIDACENNNSYSWRCYLLKYWDYIFLTNGSVSIATKCLPDWPTFHPKDRYDIWTSSAMSRFGDENSCNVFLIMAAQKWCANNKTEVHSAFKPAIPKAKATFLKNGDRIIAEYKSLKFVFTKGDVSQEVPCDDTKDIVLEMVNVLDSI